MQVEATETYNGWKNYATWGVKLVLDNDEGTYLEVREMTRAAIEDAPADPNVPDIWTAEQAARFNLADSIKDYTEELCGLGGEAYGLPELPMMAQQVIGAGLAEVDWQEIADALVRDEQEQAA